MDPLSISASITALLQLTATVIQYLSTVRGACEDRQRILSELCNINCILYTLQYQATQEDSSWSLTLQSLNVPNGPLEQFKKTLEILAKRLTPVHGWKKVSKAIAWPLEKQEIQGFFNTIKRQKTLFNLARQHDHIGLSKAIKNHVTDLRSEVGEIGQKMAELQISQSHTKIHQWLHPPDPSLNYNKALRERCAETGVWFMKHKLFDDWKSNSGSFLWLHGIPGCGKTMLSSTIIEHLLDHCSPPFAQAVLYFYFDFKDAEKQRHESMIRSFITQICSRCIHIPKELETLYLSSRNGQQQPMYNELLVTLHQILRTFEGTYLVLDALDECLEREDLLANIEELTRWNDVQLHILATSRREKDIEESMAFFDGDVKKICIQNVVVKDDIRAYVKYRLQTDRRLKRWRKEFDVQQEIENTLVDKADGMFRWAVCQLDTLGSCFSVFELRTALATLPKDLDSTYSRILCNIDVNRIRYVSKILTWLAYSAQPLQLNEIAEVIALDVEGIPRVNIERRFQEPEDILKICSALITFSGEEVKDTVTIQLAHFSVKEYLVSDRIRHGKAKAYSCQETEANFVLANDCIAYLLQFDELHFVTYSTYSEFPLSSYAALHWFQHVRIVEKNSSAATNLLTIEFLLTRCNALLNWIRLHDPDGNWFPTFREDMESIKNVLPPLYYASLLGLPQSVRMLLDKGEDINARAGHYGNALQAASSRNHGEIVQMLLDNGADVNANGGYFGNALLAASTGGHDRVVETLLRKGACVSAQTGEYDNAL